MVNNMNFKRMLKQNIKLNLDQYLVYIFSLTISVVFFFVQSTLYNSYVLIGQKNIFVISSIGVFNTALWGMFIHISFIKCRQKEFTIFLSLGMTYSELKLLTFLENILIFLIFVPIGLTLGIIFSKIIGLSIFKLAGISILTFQFKSIVYIVTIGYYALLTIIFILWTFEFINNISALNTTNHRNLYIVSSKKENVLKIAMVILIVYYIYFNEKMSLHYYIYFNEKMGIHLIAGYYFDYSFICIISVYILFSIFIKIFIIFIKKNKNFYYKRILLINEIESSLKDNKIIIFFIAFLNFIFIICKRIYYLPNVKIYFNAYSIFQGSSFNLIYISIILLSFIASANIIYFKSKIDFYNWQSKKIQFYNIGLITEEIDNIFIYKLRLIFFLHVFLNALASILFIYIFNINKEFMVNTIKILICYFIIQLLGYIITKAKIIKRDSSQ